jgi:hypothetical protein
MTITQSVPGAVATGSIQATAEFPRTATRSLPLSVLTSLPNSIRDGAVT